MFAVDPGTGEVLRGFDCAWVRADLTFHDGELWQVGGRPKRVLRLDPATGRQLGERAVLPANGRLCGVEAGPEGLWMCLREPAVVQLRDYDTMTVQHEVPVAGNPSGLTYARGVVVYSDFEDCLIRAVSPVSGEVLAEVRVEGHPVGMTWDGTAVWYCDFSARQIRAIDADHLLPPVRVPAGEGPC